MFFKYQKMIKMLILTYIQMVNQLQILLPSAANGVVLATEKKQKSILYDEQSVHKVEPITKHIGMVYSGMGPDYRYE